jgi:hypothetical protein
LPASDAFLNAAAALLCVALLWQVDWVQRRAGIPGLALLVVGCLTPLLDPLRFALNSQDQIAYLTQDPLFSGPLVTLAAITLASVGRFVLGASLLSCAMAWGWAAGGALVPIGLACLTPGGAPWLAPYSAHRYSWPVLPQDYVPVIVLPAIALAGGELWPRGKRWLVPAAAALIVLWAIPGMAGEEGFGSPAPVPPGAVRDIEPDAFWPGRWVDIVVEGSRYVAVSRGLGSDGDVPSVTPRWNDEVRLLPLLDDPVLRRFYFEVFRHPVVRVDATDSQIRLTVQELADALVGAPGPTLLYETDAHGRHQRYRVERLD